MKTQKLKKSKRLIKKKRISTFKILLIILAFSFSFLMFFRNGKVMQNILTAIKRGFRIDQSYSGKDLNIGDTVYYDHKTPKDRSNDSKLTVTLNKGSASAVGTGVDGTQTISSKNTTTKWTVWDNKDGEVVLISDVVPAGKRYGAIGYIWQEHILNLIASTYGYGNGANTDKVFAYEVGSGLEPAGDTETWNTGTNGIPKSGARAFNTSDIEEKIQNPEKTVGTYRDNKYPFAERRGGDNRYISKLRFPRKAGKSSTGSGGSHGSGGSGSHGSRPGGRYTYELDWYSLDEAIGVGDLYIDEKYFFAKKADIPNTMYKKIIFDNLIQKQYLLNDRQMSRYRNISSGGGPGLGHTEESASFLSNYINTDEGLNYGSSSSILFKYSKNTRTVKKGRDGGSTMSINTPKNNNYPSAEETQVITEEKNYPYYAEDGIRVLVYLKKNLNYTKANNQNNVWNIGKEGIVPADEINDPNGIKTGDIVYYNHKDAENINNKSKQTVILERGTSKEPGFAMQPSNIYKWKKYTVKTETLPGYRLDPPISGGYIGGGRIFSIDDGTAEVASAKENESLKVQNYANYNISIGYRAFDFNEKTGEITLTHLERGIPYGAGFYKLPNKTTLELWGAGADQGSDRLVSTHYVKQGIPKEVKNQYLGIVESETKNQYPSNGIQKDSSSGNKYWYELVSNTEAALQKQQTFAASGENTTWRVFDKTSNGGLVLISNKPVTSLATNGAVGHIWWEHNAHKMASIFGYGLGANTNATSGFKYKVGSGIENAPDMTFGDKGNWYIGSESLDKINVSGARALTFKDVQDKLGVYGTNIANGDSGIKNNRDQGYGLPYYGNTTSTSMSYVVQRNIGNSNQSWADVNRGQLNNSSYVMEDQNFWWNKTDIPASKYKDMLFNQVSGNTALATNVIDVRNSGGDVRFSRVYLSSTGIGTMENYLVETSYGTFSEYDRTFSIRPLVYLDPNVKLIPAKGESNAWDLRYDTNKNLKFNVTNKMAKNANLKVEIKPIGTTEANLRTEDISVNANSNISKTYKQTVKKGYKRSGTGDSATFSPLNNKYAVNITGLPAGAGYTVNGKENAELNLDQSLEYNVVVYDKYKLSIKDLNVRKGAKVDINDSIANLPSGSKVSLKSGSLDTTNVGQKNITIKIIVDGKEYEETIKLNVLDNIKVLTTYINRITNAPVTNIEPHYIKEGTTPTVLSQIKEDANSRYEEILKEYGTYNIKFMVESSGTGYLYTKPLGYLDTKQYSVEYVGNPNKDEYIVLKNDGKEIEGSRKYLYKNGEKVLGDTVDVEVKLIKKMSLPFTGSKALIKNTAFVMGMCILVGTVFRFRRKIILIFKRYNLMK